MIQSFWMNLAQKKGLNDTNETEHSSKKASTWQGFDKLVRNRENDAYDEIYAQCIYCDSQLC